MSSRLDADRPSVGSSSGAGPAASAVRERRDRDHTIYKPNRRGEGSAVRWSLNRDKAAVFVEAAEQSDDRQFDWEQKIIMKWGLSDLGAVLAVLQGREPQAKQFHQSEKANSAFDLSRRDDPKRAPYLLVISRQDAADKSVRKVILPITHAEAAVLETVVRAAVARLIGW